MRIRNVFDRIRDLRSVQLERSHVVVAEVAQPSLYVSYNLGQKQPVFRIRSTYHLTIFSIVREGCGHEITNLVPVPTAGG